jgi:hypothetical protein
MGCGCKKKKSQVGVTPAANRAAVPQPPGQITAPVNSNVNAVQESKDYQTKVRDALRQLMELKKRKRNLRT